MSDLLPRARLWVNEVHPHRRHLLRTEDWVVELDPDAREPLRLAAVLHDIERAFPDPAASWDSARDWDSPAYNRWHQDRCADMMAAWLRDRGADPELTAEVERLVRAHEDGGWPEADLVQAADSLSFLEVNPAARWVSEGRASAEAAERKLRWMHDRIRVEKARRLAAPLLERAAGELVSSRSTDQESALAPRVRHANEGRAHGNTR